MAWTEILYVVAIGFSIGTAIISTVVTKKHTKKQGKCESDGGGTENVDGNTENTKVESFWCELFKKLPSYIVSAETFYNQLVGKTSGLKTGAQKLAQVLDKVKIDCLTSGVEYDEKRATEMVNGLIDLTNNVNTNK